MLVVFLRTVIIYLMLMFFLRLMGKRQIGELQMSELIITILLSEVSAAPIADPEIPLLRAMIPVVTLLLLEILISYGIMKLNFLKRVFDGAPSIIIKDGVLQQKQLAKLRISVNELMGELRVMEIASLDEVEYAILEQNGKLSVIKKSKYQNVCRDDLNITPEKEEGFAHPIIIDGYVNKNSMKDLGVDDKWLESFLKKKKISQKDVFLLTLDNAGNNLLIKKDK